MEFLGWLSSHSGSTLESLLLSGCCKNFVFQEDRRVHLPNSTQASTYCVRNTAEAQLDFSVCRRACLLIVSFHPSRLAVCLLPAKCLLYATVRVFWFTQDNTEQKLFTNRAKWSFLKCQLHKLYNCIWKFPALLWEFYLLTFFIEIMKWFAIDPSAFVMQVNGAWHDLVLSRSVLWRSEYSVCLYSVRAYIFFPSRLLPIGYVLYNVCAASRPAFGQCHIISL